MADLVDTLVLLNGKRRYRVRFTNVSDGTGETNVAKVIKSTLTNLNGTVPGRLAIEKIQFSIGGFTSVRLFFDHTVPDEAAILGPGVGFIDYNPALVDPASAGGTGNITFTTAPVTPTAGSTYDITLYLILQN